MKTRVTGSPVTGRIKGGRRAAGGSGRPGRRERGFWKPPRALARPRLRTAFSDFPGSGLTLTSTTGKCSSRIHPGERPMALIQENNNRKIP